MDNFSHTYTLLFASLSTDKMGPFLKIIFGSLPSKLSYHSLVSRQLHCFCLKALLIFHKYPQLWHLVGLSNMFYTLSEGSWLLNFHGVLALHASFPWLNTWRCCLCQHWQPGHADCLIFIIFTKYIHNSIDSSCDSFSGSLTGNAVRLTLDPRTIIYVRVFFITRQ